MTNEKRLIVPLCGKLGECDADHRTVEWMRTTIKAVLDIYLDSVDENEEILDALTDVEPKAFEDQVDFNEVE